MLSILKHSELIFKPNRTTNANMAMTSNVLIKMINAYDYMTRYITFVTRITPIKQNCYTLVIMKLLEGRS